MDDSKVLVYDREGTAWDILRVLCLAFLDDEDEGYG